MSKYVVLDLEMCRVPRGAKCENFQAPRELIQIGAVLLDEQYKVVDTFMTFVKPQYGWVDDYIRRLTGIQPSSLIEAPSTEQALKMFANWLPEDAVLVTWSESDVYQIDDEMYFKGIELPELDEYLDTYIDCQQIFSEKMNADKIYKLSEALALTGADCTKGEHDALEDARNTASLFVKLQCEEFFTLNQYFITQDAMTACVFDPFKAARSAI
jgi:inhibitor of KinA sporulation pathway (predicted exonuclease)